MHALSVRGAASLVLTFAEEDPSGAHWTPQQAGGHLMNEMIGRRLGHLLSIIATLLVWGCGSKHMFIESPTLDDANSGHVTIYRPDTYFQKYRPDEPHIYIGDRKIETLGVGERISVRLPPGEHRISVRDSLLGIPDIHGRNGWIERGIGRGVLRQIRLRPVGVRHDAGWCRLSCRAVVHQRRLAAGGAERGPIGRCHPARRTGPVDPHRRVGGGSPASMQAPGSRSPEPIRVRSLPGDDCFRHAKARVDRHRGCAAEHGTARTARVRGP